MHLVNKLDRQREIDTKTYEWSDADDKKGAFWLFIIGCFIFACILGWVEESRADYDPYKSQMLYQQQQQTMIMQNMQRQQQEQYNQQQYNQNYQRLHQEIDPSIPLRSNGNTAYYYQLGRRFNQ